MEISQYARDVIPHLKEIDKGFPLFWYNPDKINGFRLTDRSFNVLVECGYSNWTFKIPVTSITSATTILLDQKVTHPWHLDRRGITFFYEPIATAMALSNNNVDTAVTLVYC